MGGFGLHPTEQLFGSTVSIILFETNAGAKGYIVLPLGRGLVIEVANVTSDSESKEQWLRSELR